MRSPVPEGRDGRQGRYARRNDSDFTPAAILVFDTEAWRTETGGTEEQTLRLWCARYVQRRAAGKNPARDQEHWGTTAAGLAALADRQARRLGRVWIYAHNLGYDLQVSGLLQEMAALGWTVTAVSSVPSYLWLSMAAHISGCRHAITAAGGDADDGAKCRCPAIRFADTVHMWPMKLAAIGDLLGTPKLQMPMADADDSEWFRYCMRDVHVATEALLTTMAYWDEHKLGRWAITNAATGFGVLRHTLPGKPWMVFNDPDGSANDRAALYGGRRQCWRHGQLHEGRYSELDMKAAYATAAASHPLPFKRGGWFDRLDVDDKRVNHRAISCIAECDIETGVPRFPVRIDGAVTYPVGRFRTILAGPEIEWARETGCLRAIGRGQWHLLGTGYQPFFRRVLEIGDTATSPAPPVVAAVWKQFGRTAIGKFAQHGYRSQPTGMLSPEILRYETTVNAATGQVEMLVHYGGQVWRNTEEGDGANAYPAVTAFVESYTRVALGKAAEAIGGTAMVLCDTDGLWTDTAAIAAGQTAAPPDGWEHFSPRDRPALMAAHLCDQTAPFEWREKHYSDVMRIAGPQVYDAAAVSKASGRPRGLQRQDKDTWSGEIFPSFGWQQNHSTPGTYRTSLQSWQWPATRILGWCLDDGRVVPLHATAAQDGATVITPWQATPGRRPRDQLAPVQHPSLQGLHEPEAGPVSTAAPPPEKGTAMNGLNQPTRAAKGDIIAHDLMPEFTMKVRDTRPCPEDYARSEPHLAYAVIDPEGNPDWLCAYDVHRA